MPAANGSVQLRALAVRLRAAGEGAWLRTMTAEMRAVVRATLVPAVHKSAEDRLPKSGGLNGRIARAKVTVSLRTGHRTAGVRMFTREHDTAATNAGFVRHPTFGRTQGKNAWHTQDIPEAAGWWTDPLEEKSPAVTPVLIEVMQRVAIEIQGRGL